MGFVAHSIRLGLRPAPAFTEGASYQGTLKGHLAALLGLFGLQDDAFLLALSSTILSFVFVLATMSLARRISGRGAALAAGLYLALGPKFPTAFQLNCVGQYVDVLALGGLALALLAKLLGESRTGREARGLYLGIGFLLGAAFWQQPVALSFLAACGTALGLRRTTWRDAWVLAVPAGLLLGALPALVWNLQHDWATREILGQSAAGGAADLLASFPRQLWRTFRISLPILAGVSPEHPWLALRPELAWVAAALLPALVVVALLLLRGQTGLLSLSPRPAALPFLLLLFSLGQFFSVPAQRVHWRPRYLLPLAGVTAVLAGVVAARAWTRSRLATVAGFGAVLTLNVAGTLPWLQAGPRVAAEYQAVVEQVEASGVRTGYADFSISAPITLFTGERILLSPELGPTPYYVSDRHSEAVRREGPGGFLLRRNDDPDAFGAGLTELGVGFERIDGPVTVFRKLSRRVSVEQARAYLVERDAPAADEESSPE